MELSGNGSSQISATTSTFWYGLRSTFQIDEDNRYEPEPKLTIMASSGKELKSVLYFLVFGQTGLTMSISQ